MRKFWKKACDLSKKFFHQLMMLPARLAVFVFVGASTYCNFEFGLAIASVIFATAMAAGDVLKGYLYKGAFNSWSLKARASGLVKLIVAVVLSAFSLTSAFGTVALMRNGQQKEISTQNQNFKTAQAAEKEALTALTNIPFPDNLRKEANAILDGPSKTDGKKIRDFVGDCAGSVKAGWYVNHYCSQVSSLFEQANKAELERKNWEKKLDKARGEIRTIGDVSETDPQAELLAKLFSFLNGKENAKMYLIAFAAIVLELVSSLGIWAVSEPVKAKTKPKSESFLRVVLSKLGRKAKSKRTKKKVRTANKSRPRLVARNGKLVAGNDNYDYTPPPASPTAMQG